MTAKEYLQQIWKISEIIKRKKEQICDLRETLRTYGLASISYDKDCVQSSPDPDSLLGLIAKIDQKEAELSEEIADLMDRKDLIIGQIMALPNPRHVEILEARYVFLEKWEDISASMQMDLRWVYRLHGRALQSFAEFYPEYLIDH